MLAHRVARGRAAIPLIDEDHRAHFDTGCLTGTRQARSGRSACALGRSGATQMPLAVVVRDARAVCF